MLERSLNDFTEFMDFLVGNDRVPDEMEMILEDDDVQFLADIIDWTE
jgi:5'-3' exonuclease